MKVVAQTVAIPLVNSTLYLMIFGVSLGNQIALKDGLPYMAFLIPGLVMMGCLNNAFQNSSSSIIASKFGGDLEDLKVAPITHWHIMTALSIAALVRGVMVGVVTWVSGEVAYFLMFDKFLSVAHWPILLLFLVLGGLCFANIGIFVGFYARTFDQLSAIGGFVLLPLIYLGGVFFSIEHLPPFWHSVAIANPLLYMINGVRYGILGQADVAWTTALAVALAAYAGTSAMAIWSLRRGSFHRW
jgi:ABC-2 type transport system permease protein